MITSKTIAALVGPTLAALALAMLLNLGSLPVLSEEISRQPALIVLSGVLLFIAGLAIVRVHNQWTAGWPMLLTVLGWLALLGGLVRMLFPTWLASLIAGFGRSTGVMAVALVVLLLVGLFLSYKGYGRE